MTPEHAAQIINMARGFWPKSGLTNQETRRLWTVKLYEKAGHASFMDAHQALKALSAGWNGDELITRTQENHSRATAVAASSFVAKVVDDAMQLDTDVRRRKEVTAEAWRSFHKAAAEARETRQQILEEKKREAEALEAKLAQRYGSKG